MLFSAAIDTAIGLMLVYLTLSLICTGINEAIAGFFRLRARNLYREVSRVLGDDTIRDAFWANGLIRGLSRGSGLGLSANPPASVARVTPGKAPSYLENKDFALALIASMRSIGKAVSPDDISGNSPLKDTVEALGIGANSTIEETRKALEDWFDQVMERASGVYKRWMSLLTFVAALAVSVAVNADTIQIARTLWQDDAARTAAVASATRLAVPGADGKPALPDLSTIGNMLPLPLGWPTEAPFGDDPMAALSKVVGLLLTAFALSLGAPFWFDLLSRFVSLRNSGPPAATSRPGRFSRRRPGRAVQASG